MPRTIIVELDGDGHAPVLLPAPRVALAALGRRPRAAAPERRREARALHVPVVRGASEDAEWVKNWAYCEERTFVQLLNALIPWGY